MDEKLKKKEYNPTIEVYRVNHSDIEKTATRQCQEHVWRKGDCELICTVCPTAIIVAPDDPRYV